MKQKKQQKADITKIKEGGQNKGEPNGDEPDPGGGDLDFDPKKFRKNR